jgi:hypothetical protein
MSLHEVGKPFVPCVVHWPEHAEYTVRAGRHELRLFRSSPPQAAIAAITGAACEFAVAHLRGVLFLLYRFEGDSDAAAPYTRGHTGQGLPGSTRTPPSPLATGRAATTEPQEMSVYLVDAGTGLLRGTRTLALSPAVWATLEAGDTLLLVTDGIIEARRGKSFLGYNGMREMARQARTAPSLRGMGEAILEGTRAFAEGSLHEDACLLLARRR